MEFLKTKLNEKRKRLETEGELPPYLSAMKEEAMKDMKKIEFHNPPTPQHEAVLKEKQAIREEEERAEREAPIQEETKREIQEVEDPPKPLEWWIQQVVFWGMALYIVIISVSPTFRAIKYFNNKEIQFAKDHPDLVKAMETYRTNRIGEVDAKIVEAFK